MGVVSGIVISYQFGTNWAVFADKAGPVVGPLMGYEVLTAFFLEAGFLGIMLFGLQARRAGPAFLRDADGRGRHADLGDLDHCGQQLDADAGRLRHQRRRPVRAGRLVGDHLQPVASPIGWCTWCWRPILTTAFVVGAVGAWHLLRDQRQPPGAHHVLDGDVDGGARHAAADPRRRQQGSTRSSTSRPRSPRWRAITRPQAGAPLILFGIPDDAAETDALRHRDPEARLADPRPFARRRDQGPQGLSAKDQRPPALIPFFTFRIMVGLGLLMLALGLWSLWARWRGTPLHQPLAAPRRAGDGAGGVHRRAGRLVHHRSRAPALSRSTACCGPSDSLSQHRCARRSAPRSSPSSSSISSSSAPASSTCCG